MGRNRVLFVSVLFLAALALRFGVTALVVDPHFRGPVGEISNDDVQFNHLAINLAEGNGYRVTPERPLTSFRAPGFPFVLALVYGALGYSPTAAYLLFALLGGAACVLTYFLAREFLTETGARVAGVFAAVYGPHVYMASQFVSENVFVPCLALGLWLVVRAVRFNPVTPTERTAARTIVEWLTAAGFFLGWATLTRPGALLLLPLVVGILVWNRCRLLPIVFFAVAFVGVILPWTMRNQQVHGKWVLIATNGGTTFWGGNNERVLTETRHLGYWIPSTELPERDRIDAAANEVERDEIEWQLGKDWVRDNIASLPLLWLYKFARLWWLPDYGGGNRWLRVVTYAPFFLMVLAFAARCLWRKTCWTPSWQVLHASMLAVIATALIFCGEPRYRDANLPVLMIYAAAGIMPTWGRAATSELIEQPQS